MSIARHTYASFMIAAGVTPRRWTVPYAALGEGIGSESLATIRRRRVDRDGAACSLRPPPAAT
ncbi:MAG TPA: hypothetical protein VF255_06650 [Solirubrobacterales bacterium]